jgi:hypothetical protein
MQPSTCLYCLAASLCKTNNLVYLLKSERTFLVWLSFILQLDLWPAGFGLPTGSRHQPMNPFFWASVQHYACHNVSVALKKKLLMLCSVMQVV